MLKVQKVIFFSLSALVLGFLVLRELFFRESLSKGLQNLLYLQPSVVYKHITVDPSLHKILKGELEDLGKRSRRIASSLGLNKKCKRNKLYIAGPGEGSTTNQIITLAHALGVASSLPRVSGEGDASYTVSLPRYMLKTLKSFDMSLLKDLYCIEVAPERTEADHETLRLAYKRKEKLDRVRAKTEHWGTTFLRLFLSVMHGSFSSTLAQDKSKTQGRTVTGSLKPGDLLLTSRDAFLWGGEVYHGMGEEEMTAMQERMKGEILGKNPAKERADGRKSEYSIRPAEDGQDVACTCHRGADYIYEVEEGYAMKRISQVEQSRMIDKVVFAGHIACVMSALWARVAPEVLHLASAVIGAGFDSKLRYHSVHKRGFEGTCTQGYVVMPVKGTKYTGQGEHSLCSLSPAYTRTLFRDRAPLYLASDQQGSDQAWLDDKESVVGWAVQNEILDKPHDTENAEPATYGYTVQAAVDVLVSTLGSGDFMGQPRSTFSWQIEILRACMGKKSVPLGGMNETDIYYRSTLGDEKEGVPPGGWVTRDSFWTALNKAHV
jgi:hypothetical protein